MAGAFGERAEYPLLDVDWRSNEEPSETAIRFLTLADGEFNPNRVKELAKLGDELVTECRGELRYAARKGQEIEMRKMRDQAEADGRLLSFDSTLRDQVMHVHTRGRNATFPWRPTGRGAPVWITLGLFKYNRDGWEDLGRCSTWTCTGGHIADCRAGGTVDCNYNNHISEKAT